MMIQKCGRRDMKGFLLSTSGLPKSADGSEFQFLLNRDQLYVIQGATSLINLALKKTKRAPKRVEVVRRIASYMSHLLNTTDQSKIFYWQFVFGREEVVELMAMFTSLILLVRTSPHVLNMSNEDHIVSVVRTFTDLHDTLKWGACAQLQGAAEA